MRKQGQRNENFANYRRARARNLSACGGEAEMTRLQLGISKAKGKTLVIGGGGARSKPLASINAPTASYHFASLGVMHMPPPVVSLKGTPNDGSP
jgi:hypothetical protein